MQDPVERRKIRRKYRALMQTAVESRQQFLKPSDHGLSTTLSEANSLYSQVRTPNEAVLDSRLLVMSGEMANIKARSIKLGAGGEFDLDDFVGRLRARLGRSEDEAADEAWAAIGGLAARGARRAAATGFLLGPLSAEKKVRTVPTRTQPTAEDRQARADAVRPEEITQASILPAQNNTSTSVVYVSAILREYGRPLELFRFVLNPRDFAQSVENLFYLSFLVRDGVVRVDTDLRGVPMVSLVSERERETARLSGETARQQAIFELDHATWRALVDVFDIRESIIPHREPTVQRTAAGAWYG
ncbi:Nse4 C-terminal-domain-containing protein [Dipodascopsis tothii]|uniref:Nse4 C-terminal-domain-containing protein n=1 Tax=Dipodascopsis tothii TaxID=44089 RepID=UPI0034CE8922